MKRKKTRHSAKVRKPSPARRPTTRRSRATSGPARTARNASPRPRIRRTAKTKTRAATRTISPIRGFMPKNRRRNPKRSMMMRKRRPAKTPRLRGQTRRTPPPSLPRNRKPFGKPYPGEERPGHVLRNTVGAETDYVVMEIDREGECAIASRRLALAVKRHFFAKGEHREGERMKCRVLAVGAKQCTAECNGFDLRLTQRDPSYSAIADLREKYRPGRELPCLLKSYDRKEGKLEISVKEVNPNPFSGADRRHPIGSRRQAVISGKYGGGVFCTLPDDTVCLCLYSAGHADADFAAGDSVIIVIRQYDYAKRLIYGRILAKW